MDEPYTNPIITYNPKDWEPLPPGNLQNIFPALQKKRWEYFRFKTKGLEDVQASLNEFGSQGWEMCGVMANGDFILKREL